MEGKTCGIDIVYDCSGVIIKLSDLTSALWSNATQIAKSGEFTKDD